MLKLDWNLGWVAGVWGKMGGYCRKPGRKVMILVWARMEVVRWRKDRDNLGHKTDKSLKIYLIRLSDCIKTLITVLSYSTMKTVIKTYLIKFYNLIKTVITGLIKLFNHFIKITSLADSYPSKNRKYTHKHTQELTRL